MELGKDIDIAKYIAGAVVVFDLRLRKIKWVQHLDLSTDHTQYRAYVYSAPTLVDLDGDGKLEIIVGTSMVSLQLCMNGFQGMKLKSIKSLLFTDAPPPCVRCWAPYRGTNP